MNVVEFSTWLQDVYTNHTFDISLVDHNESHDFASWTDPTYYFGYDNKNVTKLYNEGVAATSDKERDAKFAAAPSLSPRMRRPTGCSTTASPPPRPRALKDSPSTSTRPFCPSTT